MCTGALIFQTVTTPHELSLIELDSNLRMNSSVHSQTLVDPRFPTVRFVEGALDNDVTCWFVPNPEAVVSMLRACSFIPQQIAFPAETEIVVRCSV